MTETLRLDQELLLIQLAFYRFLERKRTEKLQGRWNSPFRRSKRSRFFVQVAPERD